MGDLKNHPHNIKKYVIMSDFSGHAPNRLPVIIYNIFNIKILDLKK